MPEMFSWYIDNNNYPTEEFLQKIIKYSLEANLNGITVAEVNKKHNPNIGNKSAAVTAGRDFGFLNDDKLSDDAIMYERGFYDYETLIFSCASKRNVSKSEDIKLKPIVVVATAFSKMRKLGIDKDDILLSTAECYKYLSPLENYDDITNELILKIVGNRTYSQLSNRIPDRCIDVRNEVLLTELFNMLVSTKVFGFGDAKTILKVNPLFWELVDYISVEGHNISIAPIANNKELYKYLSNIENGIMEIIPTIIFKQIIPKNKTQSLFEYLFGIDRHIGINWEEFFDDDHFGIYRIFFPIKKIVFAKIYLMNRDIAENLVDFSNLCKSYELTLKEDKLMIQLPFEEGHSTINELTTEVQYETKAMCSNFERNVILFGAPGTGKSFKLDLYKNSLLSDGGSYERVTFHPDYSYAQFVGSYKPCMNSLNEIEYSYVPGPFMRTLVNALRSGMTNNPKPFLLLIEEINRANIAAVFGDVFQLLDRKDGVSQYPIQLSEDAKKFLKKELDIDLKTIKIPDNMYIWATMNSADQGVFPMDTAFKRRWNFEYVGINEDEEIIKQYTYTIAGKNVNWNNLRKSINDWMAGENINEDKQLGPFYIAKNFLDDINDHNNKDSLFIKMFLNKVIMYLFEDACRSKRERLFATIDKDNTYKKRYSAICDNFVKYGIGIFNSEIIDIYNTLSLNM